MSLHIALHFFNLILKIIQVVDRAELLFAEVLNALSQMGETSGPGPHITGTKLSESRRQIAELEVMLQKEKTEFEVTSSLSCYIFFGLELYS